MQKGHILLSQKEVNRIDIIQKLESNKLTIEKATELLGLSTRQVFRLLKRLREEGIGGLVHRLRGKSSNRGYPSDLKEEVIRIYRKSYRDYGPTLFGEMLVEYHKININHETLRRWLRDQSITTSMRKKRPHRKKRERRSGYGDMLQFDGSYHTWFEDRGAPCCLLHMIDDATNRVYLKFVGSENTEEVLASLWDYCKKYGAPRSLYTDRHSVYRAENNLTDFGRALIELGSKTIFAKSPQAKGRVERGNRTFQDRLVKALRREGISTIVEANKYLEEVFMESYNDKFSLNPEAPDVHIKLEELDLKNIFCYKTIRQVRNDYTINLGGEYIQLLNSEAVLPRPKQNVYIHKWLDQTLHIFYDGKELSYEFLPGKPKKQERRITKPGKDHPWRNLNRMLKKSRT